MLQQLEEKSNNQEMAAQISSRGSAAGLVASL